MATKQTERFKEHMVALQHYLQTGRHLPGLSRSKQRVCLLQSKTHVLRDGVLYYHGPEKEGRTEKEVIMSAQRINEILHHNHSQSMSGHSGVTTTLCKITKHYWWKGIKNDVQQFISTCEVCQSFEKIKTQAPMLKPIVVTEPMELVGIDLIGPLPLTPQGHRYILTMTDYLTKWVDMFPLPTKEAKGVCSAIKTYITRWGPPKRILSDQGREFVNQLNRELCSLFDIQRSVTSSYHPQCNGLDERTNQTVKTRLGKLVTEHGTAWDTVLDDVAFSIRTQRQASTKYSPYFLMFGRNPRCFLQMGRAADDEDDDAEEIREAADENILAWVDSRKQQTDVTYQTVKENLKLAHLKDKKAFEKRASKGIKSFDLKAGDRVYRKNMRDESRKGGAMNPLWIGPYRIVDIDDHQTVRLVKDGDKEPLKARVAYRQLKPIKERDPMKKEDPIIEAAIDGSEEEAAVGGSEEEAAVGGSEEEAAVGGSEEEAAVGGSEEEAAVGGLEEPTTASPNPMEGAVGGSEEEAAVDGLEEPTTASPNPMEESDEVVRDNNPKKLVSTVYQQVKENQDHAQKKQKKVFEKRASKGTKSFDLKVVKNVEVIVEGVSGDILSYCLEKVSNLPQGHFRMTNFLNKKCDNPVTSMLRAFVSEDRLEEAIDLLHDKDIVKKFLQGVPDINQKIDVMQLAASLLLYADQHNCCPIDIMDTLNEFPPHLPVAARKRSALKLEKTKIAVANTTVEKVDLATLHGQGWLNDKVIHAFLGILGQENSWNGHKRVHLLPCFIALVWKQARYQEWHFPKVRFADVGVVLLPVCFRHHWILVVVDMEKKTVDVLDSLNTMRKDREFLSHWQKFVQARSSTVPGDIPIDGWTCGELSSSRQDNGFDCGVFVLMNAEAILANKKPALMRQCHTPMFRKYVLGAIVRRGQRSDDDMCELPCCYNPGHRDWVQCDGCDAWCHLPCANIHLSSPQMAELRFTCILCELK